MSTTSSSRQRFVVSLGGSLIVPEQGIATDFLISFRDFILDQLARHPKWQFFLVTGGGYTARSYIEAGKKVVGHELSDDDLDWLGIHSTRLNGHLVRTIFREKAYPIMLKDFDLIHKIKQPVAVAAGWKPGWSTDFIATQIAEDYHVPTVINLSNITQVYDKDPRQFANAMPQDHLDWPTYRAMVGDTWTPGLSTPFDPIAAQKAEELGLKVVVMNGDITNLQNYFEERPFVGTTLA